MQTFLDDVAKKITPTLEENNRVKLVVPNIRATLFLKEALKKTISKTLFAPEIISIETFIEELSGLKKIQKTELLLLFYTVYKSIVSTEKLMPFSQFINWASLWLAEFNEIDAQLVEYKDVFDFMASVERIEQLTLTPSEKDKSLRFQEEIPKLYETLHECLLEKEMGYSGLLQREATANLGHYITSDIPFHYFIGFNALTRAETTIFQELIAEDKAEVIWDLDQIFFHDPHHGAGHFIRQHFKKWNQLKKSELKSLSNHFSEAKHIEIISAVKNHSQAQLAVQLAKENYQKYPNASMAIVLGDEFALHSLLTALPSPDELPWNVTMGYPLKKTTLTQFFFHLIDLISSYTVKGCPYEELKSLWSIDGCKKILKPYATAIETILDECENKNISFISISLLEEIQPLIFKPFQSSNEFIQRMNLIADIGKECFSKLEDQAIELHCNRQISLIWSSLYKLQEKYSAVQTLFEIKRIFEMLIDKERLDLRGDALTGVQIMGVLETRVLDFETVIITHVNEGILPLGKSPSAVLPFDVRKKYGLNTFIEQDYIYAYHFFRLLQRAKRVYLIYNNTAEGLFTGEMSRFLIQLEYFKLDQHQLKISSIDRAITQPISKVKSVEKTPEVIAQLEEMANEGFSPSSLSLFIRDPFLFYEQRLLKIFPTDKYEENINAADKGTVIHNVLEALYKQCLGRPLNTIDFDRMLDQLPKILIEKMNNRFGISSIQTGKNYLMVEASKYILTQFLEAEKKLVKQGNTLVIEALEFPFNQPITIPGRGNIIIKGTVDRIDSINGERRIVDYKTGAITAADLAVFNCDELLIDPKKSVFFQLFLYAYALNNKIGEIKSVGVIPLKNSNTSFLPLQWKETAHKKNTIEWNALAFQNFEPILFRLIHEIFDCTQPFEQP